MSESFVLNKIITALNTEYIGKSLDFINVVDSTNNELRRCALHKNEGHTIIADKQLNGKGRLTRSWYSASKDGIYMSILLKPKLKLENIPQITLICGLALCKALRKATGIDIKIKWPNDIIHNNKKLCGILCEMQSEDNIPVYVIAGIGINLSQKEFPSDIAKKAASLYTQTNKVYDKADIIIAVLNELEACYDMYKKGFINEMIEEYNSLCATVGRNVTFTKNSKAINAVCTKVATDGSLIVLRENGAKEEVSSGEVVVQGIY